MACRSPWNSTDHLCCFLSFLELILTIFSPREYAKYSGELASITGNYFLNPLDDLNSILLPQGHYKER